MSIFRLYPGIKLSFQHGSVRNIFSPNACFCWDFRLSLLEMDQKFIIGGTIGNADSYLGFLIRHFKLARPHAIVHDAAGAMRAHSGNRPGYCYMIGRGPISCLGGHAIGLLFCFYAEPFLFPFSTPPSSKQYVVDCIRY